ncbi:MAG: EAL domain-containing protein [Sphingomonadaceae bacterium]|nr:EAL domain-containing protein [Sphingomonadaceae bacterium]
MATHPPAGRFKAALRNKRGRLFLWVALIGVLFGTFDLGEPIDTLFRTIRNTINERRPSGDTVIVAIDDRSLANLSKWPWPRRLYGQLLDRIVDLGARRVLFDMSFYAPSNRTDDRAFAAALQHAGGRAILAVRYTIDPLTGARTDFFPIPAFRRYAGLASIDADYNRNASFLRLPFAVDFAGRPIPSFAAVLGGTNGPEGATFPINFAINPRKVPTISALDLINGKVPASRLAGKQVIVAAASLQIGDMWLAPGYSMIPGAYFHVLGAETLRRGLPLDVPWEIPFGLALVVVGATLTLRRHTPAVVALSAALAATLLLPILLDRMSLVVETNAALVMLLIVLGNRLWLIYQHRYRLRGTTNAISGLPNLNALREAPGSQGGALVVARVTNFSEIAAALPQDMEKALVEQIADRLALGHGRQSIHQGDEGLFAWFLGDIAEGAMGDHLDALHALFRSPIAVDGRRLDLVVAFGVDAEQGRAIGNRIGSALVAADEAFADGLKWKLYDPGKLKDADWKLSLLGELDAAIAAGDVWTAFQPKLDLVSRRIIGAEALVRWTHPVKGFIPPDAFIPAAEQSNRIEELTLHVLTQSVRAAALINGHGIDFGIAVNLSTRLLDSPGLAARIAEVLAAHRLSPHHLTLEVTETAALGDDANVLGVLGGLRDLGVNVSIDDYGTGLSTLEYLRKIPANEIKVDKSFVQAMDRSAGDRMMVASTIELAHSLGKRVVAEGIETDSALDALAGMGCDIGQGYFIGRPMRFLALSRLLLGQQRLAA